MHITNAGKMFSVCLIAGSLLALTIPAAHAQDSRPSIDPATQCSPPPYPAEALVHNEEGQVVVAVFINAEGNVEESKIETSSGHAVLDKVSHETFSHCKFKPALEKGKPVKSWLSLPINWKIPKDNPQLFNARRDVSYACEKPRYPEDSIAAKEQGITSLGLLVQADGHVSDIRILDSSGFARLDTVALEAIKLCKFLPNQTNGKTEAAWSIYKYSWVISENGFMGARFDAKYPCTTSIPPSEVPQPNKLGKTVISIFIGVKGNVAESRIEESGGDTRLDEMIRQEINRCKFKPSYYTDMKIGGVLPKASWGKIAYDWSKYNAEN